MQTTLNNDTVTVQMTKDEFINFTNAVESIHLATNSRHTETLEDLNNQIYALERENGNTKLLSSLNKAYRGFSSMSLMLMDGDYILSEFRNDTTQLSNRLQLQN
jgi:hypothetical protein